jgi:uncharacterized membrane protein YhhN
MVIWLGLAAVVAIGDWTAVVRRSKPIEYVCKPAVMLALIGVALAVDPRSTSMRSWFVVALVFSMLGDVFLMLPSDQFVFGLASFLLAHVAYVAGFGSVEPWAVAVVVVACSIVATPILRAVWRGDDPSLRVPVVVYMLVIAAMVACALSTHRWLAIAGAGLFFSSDATIAWNRFVSAKRWAPLFIIVTYHLGQAGLVLSLAR